MRSGFTKRVAGAVAELVLADVRHNVPERHASNSGKMLEQRIEDSGISLPSPRNGDPKALRQLYSALYWFATKHEFDDPQADTNKGASNG